MATLEGFVDEILTEVADGTELLRIANHVLALSPSVGLTLKHRDSIVGWSFANIQSVWESFLEKCFVAYLLGMRAASGFAPTRYVFPANEAHALAFIRGKRDFFRWTSPTLVKEYSRLCFRDGDPFISGLDPIMTDLEELNTIRNAIVHKSVDASNKFKSLVRSKLATAPLDITPSVFLLTARSAAVTYFGHYCKIIAIGAGRIVPS
jgi:hypothetical protein